MRPNEGRDQDETERGMSPRRPNGGQYSYQGNETGDETEV